MITRDDVRRTGEALRDELFGASGPAALAEPALGFDALMAELVYANVWARPGLARQDRMAVTLAVLCAMQNLAQLRRHLGIALDADPPRADPLEVLTERGRELQAALHGDRRNDGHASPDNPVTGTVYPLVVQYAYGEIWDRPGLDRRIRALCAVACFAALSHDVLLRKFALSALNVGATKDEVIEAIVQSGSYGGFAFMLKALGIVSEAFAAA